MTSQTLSIKSENAEATEKIGETIGANIKGGEVIVLSSDLGGGKTTFVRGVMRGMQSPDRVTSPSFKISNTYKARGLVVDHFDFYRLLDPGLLVHELSDSFEDKSVVTIIEWAGIVEGILPKDRLEIRIDTLEEDSRKLEFNYNQTTEYLIKGLPLSI